MAAPTTAYTPIRPTDLQDPLLTTLNNKLQNYAIQLTSLGAATNPTGSQTANVWQTWDMNVPNIKTTMTYSITSLVENSYLQEANKIFVNLDIQLNLGGTATNFISFAPPNNIVPAVNGGNLMSAISYPAAANALPVYARTENNGIIVVPVNGLAYPLGIIEILVSGWYRI